MNKQRGDACIITVVSTIFGLILLIGPAAAQIQFPELTERVVDEANLLSDLKEAEVTEMLRAHEAETSNQVVVVTLQSLQGLTIEEFGVELGSHWEIGQEGRNNGVLLVIAPNERLMRIEVGYGLEGVLTDARASVIIQNKMVPAFRSGDRTKGIVDGVREILKVLKAGPQKVVAPPPDDSRFPIPPFFIFFIFIVIIMLLRTTSVLPSGRSRYLGGFSSGRSCGFSGGSGFSGGGGSFGGGGSSGSW